MLPPLSAASRSFEHCISVQSNPLPVKLLYWEWEWKRKSLATIMKHFSNTVQFLSKNHELFDTCAESIEEILYSTSNKTILYSMRKIWRKNKKHTSVSMLWDFRLFRLCINVPGYCLCEVRTATF